MKTHLDPQKTTPIGLARYACDYYDAAMAADDALGDRPGYEFNAPIPVMYLVGQSIELCLKSYLVFKGVSLVDIKSKKYGHDLEACLTKAEDMNLSKFVQLDADDRKVLRVLNRLYSTKQLNYIETGWKEFPVFGPLETLCEKLLEAICPAVGYHKDA